jgi:hypothetical protein
MPFLRVFAPGVLALLVFQVASGDLSTGNVWLATQLLDVMLSYEQW